MIKLICTAILVTVLSSYTGTNGVYDFQVVTTDGDTISLGSFQGKRILFVNTATNSPSVNQYAALEQLYSQYRDSLVVIAFPSNSFGNEPGGNADIKSFVTGNYNIHYILASKISVAAGDSAEAPLYRWLTQQSENGVMDNNVGGDFYKYLVDENGNLTGAFDNTVDPMSDLMQNLMHH